MGFGFRRHRKRMRQVKIEFERSSATGSLTYSYYLDGSSTKVDSTINFGDTDPRTGSTYASQGFWIKKFPLGVYPVTLRHRFYNNDIETLSIKAARYKFSIEPLFTDL